MGTVDCLLSASCAARLLPGTLGPVPAASPSKAHEELFPAVSGPLKVSKELMEQAKQVMKESADIRKLYKDDGAKGAFEGNDRNNQRRPGLNRRRGHFTLKPAASKPSVPEVNFSVLDNISDPVQYFETLEKLQEAQEEINRLTGVVPTERVDNHQDADKKERRPGLPGRRKSKHTYYFSEGDHTGNGIEMPASETGTTTEPQFTQEVGHASISEKTRQCVPSELKKRPISDVSATEDSSAEKENVHVSTRVLSSSQNLGGRFEDDAEILKTLGIKDINLSRVSLCDSAISGGRLQKSNNMRKSPRVLAPGRPVLGSHHARILELEKICFGSVPKDKCTDVSGDESERSADIVFPSPSIKPAEHVLDPEPNITDCVTVDEMQTGGSPLSLHRDTEVVKEKDVSSRPTISLEFAMEEDDVAMNHPTIDQSNNETGVSSPHLNTSSTEQLLSTPCRNVASDDVSRILHAAEDSIQHQEEVEGVDGVLKDQSSHPSEVPPKDIDPQNQPQGHDGNFKELAASLGDAPSPTKELQSKRKRKTAPKGKKKQQSKRNEKVADESSHPLEIPQESLVPENQPPNYDLNIEQQTVDNSISLSNKIKGQKRAPRGKGARRSDRRESLADAGLAWQDGVRKSTRMRSRPLKDWLGERFVFGRIHDSMPTVIGVKSFSPDQDGKKVLKVKSFVPEKYADLVASCAMY